MTIYDEYIDIKNSRIHYLKAKNDNSEGTVILLHGKKYNAYDWVNSGIIDRLNNEGFEVIALELPGYGLSEDLNLEKEDFLHEFVVQLNIEAFHLVGPSFSGEISIKFALKYGSMLKTLTIIDSINVDKYGELLKNIRAKTLIVWGKNDDIAPYEFAGMLKYNIINSTLFTFDNLGHTCYFDEPEIFSDVLMKFIKTF
ncbi:alpha/beta fold hydrolase [Tepidibacillus sp. LV47]|uniref:alpha/beta fold hydrolase n=1 Tax=Tepidibacillus sp. LV47 TaxID=3398228 RepID=UPI003AAC7AFA